MKRPNQTTLILVLITGAMLASMFVRGMRNSDLAGAPAPSFTLPVAYAYGGAPSNERVRLSDLRGHVVVLDFWASWCGPCKASMPEMNELAEKYRDRNVEVLGINSEPIGVGQLAFVAQSWRFAYPVLADASLEAARGYAVQAYPTIFVIDRTGIVRHVHFGAPGARTLGRQIERLLE